jgi:hypothetical protein
VPVINQPHFFIIFMIWLDIVISGLFGNTLLVAIIRNTILSESVKAVVAFNKLAVIESI